MTLIKRILRWGIEQTQRSESPSDVARLRAYAESGRAIKLHFGCGPRILKGWVNIDLAFEPYENYLKYYGDEFYPEGIRGGRCDFFVLDVTKEHLPFEDNSVDVVFHEDFIEHIDQRSQWLFLAEVFRVLKPGSIHRVNTPDLNYSMSQHSDFTKGAAGVYIEEWDKHAHKNVLTHSLLAEMATIIGYREVNYTKRDGSAAPMLPREYRPDPNDRHECGNIFADLIK